MITIYFPSFSFHFCTWLKPFVGLLKNHIMLDVFRSLGLLNKPSDCYAQAQCSASFSHPNSGLSGPLSLWEVMRIFIFRLEPFLDRASHSKDAQWSSQHSISNRYLARWYNSLHVFGFILPLEKATRRIFGASDNAKKTRLHKKCLSKLTEKLFTEVFLSRTQSSLRIRDLFH